MAAFLGATPGCLGAFAVVAMYTHRTLSVGAVVAAMVATAGDESFVMFAMIPKTALWLHGMLPLLAHSRRAFLVVKLINLLVGLLVGGSVMALSAGP